MVNEYCVMSIAYEYLEQLVILGLIWQKNSKSFEDI